MKKHPFKKIATIFIAIPFLIFIAFYLYSFKLNYELLKRYEELQSVVIVDRNGKEICVKQNAYGNYMRRAFQFPQGLKELIIQKEDKYFFYHPGFNPISIIKASLGYLEFGKRKASSTITQQLTKILLHTESERNIKNKLREALFTFALEMHNKKNIILEMYLNSIYFGNHSQGISEAAQLYFGSNPETLSAGEILQLLATLSNPNENNPAKKNNIAKSEDLMKHICNPAAETAGCLTFFIPRSQIPFNSPSPATTGSGSLGVPLSPSSLRKSSEGVWRRGIKKLGVAKEKFNFSDSTKVQGIMAQYTHLNNTCFEYSSFPNPFAYSKMVTLDSFYTEKIRSIAQDTIAQIRYKNANNAAVVVIKLPENEILSLVGSLDPNSSREGNQIDMTRKPRAIGSTIKPFIYLKAFEKNLRPYTLVDDREYKYNTLLGFPLYPKNYDWKYHGEVTLYYALSNSLNVPAVKTLEFVGVNNFYSFLKNDLGFTPIQPMEKYQLGIALGTLEMSLYDLSRYFTIFPNHGTLRDLKIDNSKKESGDKIISDQKYIGLVNKILNDRKTAMDQFGMKSDLDLFQKNYALKTGTSRDYRDSWVIGYTPDFLVGVWVGNHDTSPMDEVSGQLGAGKIWAKTMELFMNSEYNKKTPLTFDSLKEFLDGGTIQYGLFGDNDEEYKNLLKNSDTSLILMPHDQDIFQLEKNTKIILRAKEKVRWFINNELFGEGAEKVFVPKKTGQYKITAEDMQNKGKTITITIN